MTARVVCGVDDSEGGRRAAEVAAGLAEVLGAELVLVHVAQVEPIPGASSVPCGHRELAQLALAAAEGVLDEVAAGTGLDDVRRRAELGATGDALRRVAQEERASMIVVGSRGRGGLRAALAGSVSSALCRRSPCPVVVVPPDQATARSARAGSRSA